MPRYKGCSAPPGVPVAFRTFGAIRPLVNKFVLPVYSDPNAPPFDMVCDSPWRNRHYCEEFKRIKKLAGWSDDLWSMDARAGGATETDSIGDVTDRALQDSGGWADAKTPSRYRRHKQRNAQNVVKLRQRRQNGR